MKNLNNNTTIELVGYGHTDRFSDYLAEFLLSKILEQDKKAKVAIEVLSTGTSISLGGEVTTIAKIDYDKLIYDSIEKIYGEKWWPNYKNVKVFNHISEQSYELTKNQTDKMVAGDQGVIYGYYDKKRFNIIKTLYKLMDELKLKFDISPDWKLLFDTEKKELSMSVCGKVDHNQIKTFIEKNYSTFKIVIINPKGEWLISGPLSDTGVVGRKLMIDTFGAGIPHGGGAFCGKDPSKVDKTGIIIASYLAKQISQDRKCDKALVELNYKIGDEFPKAFAYFEDGGKIDITDNIDLTLEEYVLKFKLLEEEWSQYVLKGGVIFYLQRNK